MIRSNLEISIEYSNNCINDIIPSCLEVKQACKRFLNDLDTYTFKEDKVKHVIDFISILKLSEINEPFILEPWQVFIISNIYGLYDPLTYLRKYKYVYIEIARKNGKSEFITALSVYHLIYDIDSQVTLSANSRDQIKNVDFKKVKNFCIQLDRQQRNLIHYYNSIKFKKNELLTTASDSRKLDGLSVSTGIIDELHEAPDNKMYNVIKSSQGSRKEPLLITITTAGFNTDSFCFQLRNYVKEILRGDKVDNSQFGIIYTLDENDDYRDERNWIKSNPNLGVSVQKSFIESEVNKAINNQIEEPGVLVKNFNIWLKNKTEEIWIPESVLDRSFSNISLDEDIFKGLDVWCGIDLSSVSDISSVTYMIQLDNKLYFLNNYYLPEYNINSNSNKDYYKEMASLGYIKLTEGNVIDYDIILNDILKVNMNNNIINTFYDRYNSTQFIIDLTNKGINNEPFSQTAGNLNQPIKELYRLINNGNITINKNPVTRWMFNNVIIKQDKNGNQSIDKSSKKNKIDGVASMLNVLGGYLKSPRYSFNIY